MKSVVKKILAATLCLTFAVGLVACSGDQAAKGKGGKEAIKIGTFPSTTQLPNILKDSLADEYDVEIVLFDGNNMPAEALNAKELDGIIGNGDKWLATYNKENNTNLVMVDKLYSHFSGLYSEKYKSTEEFPDGAKIAIANDPTNVNNALKLLQNSGLIDLSEKPGSGNVYTTLDITKNDKNLEFMQMDLTMIAKNMKDVDGVVTSAILIKEAGGDPMSFLALPNQEDLQKNGLIVNADDQYKGWVKKAVEVGHTEENKKKLMEELEGTAFLLEDADAFFAKNKAE